jgi:hypothetical protein
MSKTFRDFDKEYQNYHSTPKAKKDRAKRNKARRQAMKSSRVTLGSNLDVDHKTPLRAGGSADKSNTRLRDKSSNRADNGHHKGEKQSKWKK